MKAFLFIKKVTSIASKRLTLKMQCRVASSLDRDQSLLPAILPEAGTTYREEAESRDIQHTLNVYLGFKHGGPKHLRKSG